LPDSERRDRHIRLMVREEDYEALAELAEERGQRVSTVAYQLVLNALRRIKTRSRGSQRRKPRKK